MDLGLVLALSGHPQGQAEVRMPEGDGGCIWRMQGEEMGLYIIADHPG